MGNVARLQLDTLSDGANGLQLGQHSPQSIEFSPSCPFYYQRAYRASINQASSYMADDLWVIERLVERLPNSN
jgi:hypothetical protein